MHYRSGRPFEQPFEQNCIIYLIPCDPVSTKMVPYVSLFQGGRDAVTHVFVCTTVSLYVYAVCLTQKMLFRAMSYVEYAVRIGRKEFC